MPGPRLFASLRLVLVIVTLITTAFTYMSLTFSESDQEAAATRIGHLQDMSDLETHLEYANAAAMTSLLPPSNDRTSEQWSLYQNTVDMTAYLLLAAGASAQHEDMGPTVTSVFAWQEALAVANHEAAAEGVSLDTVNLLTSRHHDLEDNLNAPNDAPSLTIPSTWDWIAIIVGCVACAAFLAALIVIARRTHRVINVGVAIGLLAMLASTTILGTYLSNASDIALEDSRMDTLSQVISDTWRTKSLAVTSVLDSTPADLVQAAQITEDIQDQLRSLGIDSHEAEALAVTLASLDPADPTATTTSILEATVWDDLVTPIAEAINRERTDASSLVSNSANESFFVVVLGVVAISATLGGIFVRTREYA